MLSTAVRSDPYQNPRSIAYQFRQRRYRHIRILIDRIIARQGRCRIIDIGGTEGYWSIASGQIDDPRIEIDLVNLEPAQAKKPNFRSMVANACDMHEFADMSYDFVHSNSVIEHVGTWNDMVRFAANVRRLAPTYFVQTPYFWFPIEPHFRFPLFHWLPESAQYRLIMSGDMGHVTRATSVVDAVRSIQGFKLLDARQYAALFPDADMKFERALGVTKSLMAIRSMSN
jgi:hypothetical protein